MCERDETLHISGLAAGKVLEPVLRGAYYRIISLLAGLSGPSGLERLAGVFARVRYAGNGRLKAAYLGHLARIFPGRDAAGLRRILREYWRVHQRAFLGLFHSRRFNADNIGGFTEWTGRELLDEAVSAGRGVLLLTPHFGDERTLHILLAISGYRMHVVSSRYADAPEFLRRARLSVSRKWHHVAFPDEPLAWLFKALERGEVVQISPTGYGGPGGHWVMSFGVPVLVSSSPVRIAALSGCRLMTAFNRALPGMRYHLSLEGFDPGRLDESGTARLVERFERMALLYPEQYNWMNLVIRHRETNTISRLGGIPRDESVLEAEAVPSDWDPANVRPFQSVSSIGEMEARSAE